MSRRSGRDAQLAIALFGQPRLWSRGVPLVFRGRPRSMALLAYLLLHRESHLTRDALAFALWPDDSEADARANLRRHLHHLSTTLPASDVPYILTHEDTIRWNADADVWFDVDVFERCIADPELLADAVDLYAGDLLPGVYDDWIFPIRDRLRRAFLAALETLMQRCRSRRDFTRAKAYAGSILVHDPWREDTLRQLASICYESGDRAGALREIDEFARRLAAEMNVEPMPETVALRARILRGNAVPADPRAPPDEVRAAATFFPFVGRKAERDQLETAWRRAARSRGDVLFVAGEAGIGKSRLVGELALLAEAQGGRVLRGTTTAPEALPYAAIIEGLRDALPLLAALTIRPIWLAVLAALLPELALTRDDLPAVPPLDPQRERLRLFEALASVVTGLARERPLLFLLEDIHWAGDATLAALEYLARRSAGLPGLIVATYRTAAGDAHPGLPALRRRLQREGVSQHLQIGGLGVDAITELARAIPAVRERAAELGREIHAVSGGNPLFAGELLRERAESTGSDVTGSGLRATLEARVARLTDDAALLARIASVIGTTFEIDLVCEVCGWDENAALGVMGELLERNVVREAGRARFAFAFTHALIATTIYGSIDAPRRRHWHERIALAIERGAVDRDALAGTLAAHFDAAGAAERAWPYYIAAAQRAFAVFANTEALTATSRALELVTDDAARYEVLALRERIRGRLGDRDGQRADIDALAALTGVAERPAAAADLVWRRAQLARACGDVAGEQTLLAMFMAAVHVFGDPSREAAGRCAVARNMFAASRYDDANAAAEDALERYRAVADRAGQVEALCLLAEIAVDHGSAERVDACLESAQTAAAEQADRDLIARVAMARAMAAINRRHFAAARESAGEALLRYRELGDREGEAEALSRVASALSMLVQFDAARADFKTAGEIYRSIGARLRLAYLLFNESTIEMQLGLFSAGETSIRTALPIFEQAADLRGLAVCRTNLSMIHLHAGDPVQARSIGLQALADARAIEHPLIEAAALANLGNAERELREFDAALEHMHAAVEIRHRLGLSATFEELSDLALTQFVSGDHAAGRATADDIMLRAPASDENTVWPHYCFWAAACVYHGCGDDARAARALELALARIRDQLGSTADDASRAAFMQLVSVRAVHAAADHGIWPEGFAAATAGRSARARANRP